MRQVFVVLLSAVLLTGCVSTSTIQSRRQAHAAAYASFPPQIKTLVDQGQIAVGMTTDAVDIAWGPPDEVLQSGDQRGVLTTWIYRGSFLEQTGYWAGRRHPYLTFDYEPRTYVRAEITFANGVVRSWRTLPQPIY